ncbi:MAG: hypothetical protein OXD01_07940 [Gammaproteobacteria bacterium]|nr:hypothetical protein [Gammaproteobacteria bacterium]
MIEQDETGNSFKEIIGPYLNSAKSVEIDDPYISTHYQIENFVRICEVVVNSKSIKSILLKTKINGSDGLNNEKETSDKLKELKTSLSPHNIKLEWKFNKNIHDREIRIDNGWVIKIGRGLDFFDRQKSWFCVGAYDQTLRKCRETKVDIFKNPPQ